MKRKGISLFSGSVNGWSWILSVRVKENGVINSSGEIGLVNNEEQYHRNKKYWKDYTQTEDYKSTKKIYAQSERGKEVHKKANSKYGQTENGKIHARKHTARHRELGWSEINEPFINSHGHHINKKEVIYVPDEIHQSVSHNIWTGHNMDIINDLAQEFLLRELGEC